MRGVPFWADGSMSTRSGKAKVVDSGAPKTRPSLLNKVRFQDRGDIDQAQLALMSCPCPKEIVPRATQY